MLVPSGNSSVLIISLGNCEKLYGIPGNSEYVIVFLGNS